MLFLKNKRQTSHILNPTKGGAMFFTFSDEGIQSPFKGSLQTKSVDVLGDDGDCANENTLSSINLTMQQRDLILETDRESVHNESSLADVQIESESSYELNPNAQ